MLVDYVENNLYGGFSKFDHTLSPIGNRETTKRMTIDDLYNCYNAFYTDDRKFIVVAGNVDENRIVDCINNALSKCSKHESHLILPTIDFDSMRRTNGVIHRPTEEPIAALGIKVKKPEFMTMKEFDYVMSILESYSYSSRAANELNKSGILDTYEYVYLTNVADYINYIVSFTARNKRECSQRLLELFSKKDLSKKDYELLRKVMISSEVRSMDSKYSYVQAFPDNIYCTESYSDIDFYQSISYDYFQHMLESLDFSNYTIGEVKQLRKKESH
jgi:predicted Zn-dependent peptidase